MQTEGETFILPPQRRRTGFLYLGREGAKQLFTKLFHTAQRRKSSSLQGLLTSLPPPKKYFLPAWDLLKLGVVQAPFQEREKQTEADDETAEGWLRNPMTGGISSLDHVFPGLLSFPVRDTDGHPARCAAANRRLKSLIKRKRRPVCKNAGLAGRSLEREGQG